MSTGVTPHASVQAMITEVRPAPNETLADLYRANYRALVRLAAIVLDDRAASEEVVQDAFVALHRRWDSVSNPSKRLAYLRSAVLNGARSRGRRRTIRRRVERSGRSDSTTLMETPETSALRAEDNREVINALRALAPRQRDCLILRYYVELTEREIAETLGISAGSVKTHTRRGMAALERALEALR